MKKTTRRKTCFKIAALAAGILWSGTSFSAALTNGDFSAGFTGWQGQADFADVGLPNANFDASSGAAVLTTSFDNAGPYALHLFQNFDLPVLSAPGNTLELDFSAFWSHDDVADTWLAQLIDTSNPSHYLDMSAGSTPYDVTGFSGLNVQLLFGLENIGGGDDSLSIDNITITERQGVIPEPATLLLVGTGLVALRRKLF